MAVTPHRRRRWLGIVRWLTWLDVALLAVLIAASVADERLAVQVLGWTHGIVFLLLVVVVSVAAVIGMWSWWFPVVVLLTGGTLGALIGERILSRRLAGDRSTNVS